MAKTKTIIKKVYRCADGHICERDDSDPNKHGNIPCGDCRNPAPLLLIDGESALFIVSHDPGPVCSREEAQRAVNIKRTIRRLFATLLIAATAGAADFDLTAYITALNNANANLARLEPVMVEFDRQARLIDYWLDWYEFQAEADAAAERIFTGKPETVFIPVTDGLEIL